ncbi:MAG: histidine phosphatase family protein [Ghiorsea sp.]
MKSLLLIRHAKADWGTPGSRDYDRVLNPRGLRDAADMGQRIQAKNKVPDLFVASTAKRAEMSTQLMTQAMGYTIKNVEWFENLYLAMPSTILKVIMDTGDTLSSLALLAHNPGITELAEQLSGEYIGDMPTSAVVHLTAPINHWKEANTVWQLQDFDYPNLQA